LSSISAKKIVIGAGKIVIDRGGKTVTKQHGQDSHRSRNVTTPPPSSTNHFSRQQPVESRMKAIKPLRLLTGTVEHKFMVVRQDIPDRDDSHQPLALEDKDMQYWATTSQYISPHSHHKPDGRRGRHGRHQARTYTQRTFSVFAYISLHLCIFLFNTFRPSSCSLRIAARKLAFRTTTPCPTYSASHTFIIQPSADILEQKFYSYPNECFRDDAIIRIHHEDLLTHRCHHHKDENSIGPRPSMLMECCSV